MRKKNTILYPHKVVSCLNYKQNPTIFVLHRRFQAACSKSRRKCPDEKCTTHTTDTESLIVRALALACVAGNQGKLSETILTEKCARPAAENSLYFSRVQHTRRDTRTHTHKNPHVRIPLARAVRLFKKLNNTLPPTHQPAWIISIHAYAYHAYLIFARIRCKHRLPGAR